MPYQNQADKTKEPYRLSIGGATLFASFEWDSTDTRLIFHTVLKKYAENEDQNEHWDNSRFLFGFTESLFPWFSYTPGAMWDCMKWLIQDLSEYYHRYGKSGRVAHIEMKINQICFQMWYDILVKNCGDKAQTVTYLLEEFEKYGISIQDNTIPTSE